MMTSKKALIMSSILIAFTAIGMSVVFAAEPTETALNTIDTSIGGNLGLGIGAGGTWGFLVYLYSKIIVDKTTKFDRRKFLKTILVGIGTAIIVEVLNLDWNAAAAALATFGITPYIDKLVNALIVNYNAKKTVTS